MLFFPGSRMVLFQTLAWQLRLLRVLFAALLLLGSISGKFQVSYYSGSSGSCHAPSCTETRLAEQDSPRKPKGTPFGHDEFFFRGGMPGPRMSLKPYSSEGSDALL